ncbi:hypothetical protein BH10CHL1_BH10CHL1_15620 [soil metagenome]
MLQIKRERHVLWWRIGVVGGLTLLFGLVNWHWLGVNVVTYGWDRMDHLITSLAYNNILQTITPQSIFNALVYSNYYPPFVHLTVWVFYKLFGVNEDVAVMVNVIYLLILLGATWSIAERMGGVKVAALAVTLLGAFPMIFAMSRYLYLDFALTAMVALAIALLLATARFTRRRQAYWFGAALGMAFLVKWTAAAFLITPLFFILWRGGILTALVQHTAALRPDWRRLVFVLIISLLLTVAWFIPAHAAVFQSPLGNWLFPAYALLTTPFLYALSCSISNQPPELRPLHNALSAGAVTIWIMAFWYLPNSEFITGFLHTAYGLEDGRFWAYGKYLYEVSTEQLGPALSAAFVLVVLVFLWQRRKTLRQLLQTLDDQAWILLLWAIAPYIIFSTRVSLAHDRFLMPFLPPFAIWMAYGLWQWRSRLIRNVTIVLVLLVAAAQFVLISFEVAAPWRAPLHLQLPGGSVNLLAHGFFLQYPASEETDPGFAITPEVLTLVDNARVAHKRDRINLGLLVNSYELHEKHFLYQIYTTYPQVTLRELARNWNDQPAYNQLFEMDFVLVDDTHTFRTSEASQAVVKRILTQPEDLFNRAFQPVHHWTLPSKEKVTLYERRFADTEPGLAPADYQTLLQQFGVNWGPDDALVLTAPDQAYIMGLSLPADNTLSILPLPTGLKADQESLNALAQLAQTHDRIFLLNHNAATVDPDGTIENWLRGHWLAGPDIWINALRVTPFIAEKMPAAPTEMINAQWRQSATLRGIAINQEALHASGALAVQLYWQRLGLADHKISLQLLGPDGALVAQQDADMTKAQPPFVLLLPHELAPGAYKLIAILYDPKTLKRDKLVNGPDALALWTFTQQ